MNALQLRVPEQAHGRFLPAFSMLEPVSYAKLDHVFAWISKSGDTTSQGIADARPPVGRQLSSTKLSGVTWVMLVRGLDPDVGILVCPGSHAARCTVAAGITPARHLEAAVRTPRVQMWSLAHTTQDASSKWD